MKQLKRTDYRAPLTSAGVALYPESGILVNSDDNVSESIILDGQFTDGYYEPGDIDVNGWN